MNDKAGGVKEERKHGEGEIKRNSRGIQDPGFGLAPQPLEEEAGLRRRGRAASLILTAKQGRTGKLGEEAWDPEV